MFSFFFTTLPISKYIINISLNSDTAIIIGVQNIITHGIVPFELDIYDTVNIHCGVFESSHGCRTTIEVHQQVYSYIQQVPLDSPSKEYNNNNNNTICTLLERQ